MSEPEEPSRGATLPFLDLEAEVLRYLRRRRGWTQVQLGEAAELSGQAVNHYELGRRLLKPRRFASLTEAMGYGEAEVRLYRMVVEGRPPLIDPRAVAALDDLAEGEARRVRGSGAENGLVVARDFEERFGSHLVRAVVAARKREAERTFRIWQQASSEEQRLLIDSHPDFQTPGLIEQVCLASERSAAKDPKLPLRFAQLALRAAERMPGSPMKRSRMRGYVWAFVGNARRVAVGLREADEDFQESERLWVAGAGAQGLFLEEWRLPDLKASLRRDQRLWKESLNLSDQALAQAPASARGRILVKKAAALEPMGEPVLALSALEEAAPSIESGDDRSLLLALHFNFAVNLTHLGELQEADRRLGYARDLALELGQDLHLNHCVWLAGRIAAEGGRTTEAFSALAQARREFTVRKMPLEAASVALDESIYRLQAGDAQVVAQLAEDVAWVFAAEGVGAEALKALWVFSEAAREHLMTLELARKLREQFRKAD